MNADLDDEEAVLVETVRPFVERDVKPNVREVEHANEYREAAGALRACQTADAQAGAQAARG